MTEELKKCPLCELKWCPWCNYLSLALKRRETWFGSMDWVVCYKCKAEGANVYEVGGNYFTAYDKPVGAND